MSRQMHSHEPGLIQDITYRAATPSYRHGKIQHGATIGELDDAWQRQADTAYRGLGILPYSVPAAKKPHSLYNPAVRVAPLSLHEVDLSQGTPESIVQRLRDEAILVWAAVSAFMERSWLHVTNAAKKYPPKKYTLNHGAYTDWSAAALVGLKRYGVPLGAAALLVIMALALPNSSSISTPAKKGHNPTVTVQTTADGKPSSGKSTSSTQSAATTKGTSSTSGGSQSAPSASPSSTSQGSAQALPGTFGAPTTYTGGLIGGYGGGSGGSSSTGSRGSTSGGSSSSGTTSTTTPTSGTSTPTVGSIPGVTSPYPVTTPGQTVDANGKPVIGTSPTTITLN